MLVIPLLSSPTSPCHIIIFSGTIPADLLQIVLPVRARHKRKSSAIPEALAATRSAG